MGLLTPAGLKLACDRNLPNTGTIGYFLLINNDLLTAAPATADAGTNEFTLGVSHSLVTGTRVRVATSGGTLPAPLSPTVDYFIATLFVGAGIKLCATLADAIAGNAIDITSTGSNLTINEQLLLPTDRQQVIMAHECAGNNYTRRAVTDIGGAVVTAAGLALKNAVSWSQQALGGAIVYRHVVFLDGGTATAGNATGTLTHMETLSNPTTIADTSIQLIAFQLGAKN